MAIDSRDKRQSVIGVTLPVPSVLPTADSSVDEFDRRQLVWLYQALASVVVNTPTARIRTVDAETRIVPIAAETRIVEVTL